MQFCMQCGQQNDDDSVFCIGCGQPLNPVEEAPAPDPAPAFQASGNMEAVDLMPSTTGAHAPQETIDIYAAARLSEEAVEEPSLEPKAGPAHAEPSSFDESEALEAIEDLDERLSTVESLIKDRASMLEAALDKLSEQFEGKISRNEHEATVLKNMSDEMQTYRDDLYGKLTLPLIKDMIEAREALGMALARHVASPDASDASLANDIALCRDMLGDSLMRNAVEVVVSKPGEDFESFKHKIVGKMPTSDAAQHGKVAEVSGDSYKMAGQYIAPAMVKVYSLEEGSN